MFEQQQKHNRKLNPYLKHSNVLIKNTIISFFNRFKYVSEQKTMASMKTVAAKQKKKCQTNSTYHSGIGQQIWTCYRQKHSEEYDFLKSNQNSSIRPEKNSTYGRICHS
jgi:hypothetical protein